MTEEYRDVTIGPRFPAGGGDAHESALGALSLDRQAQTSSTARATGYSLTSTVVQGGVRFLSGAAVGRIGGPELLGTVAPAIALAQLSSLMWPTSVGAAASKFVARARGEGDPERARAVSRHLLARTLQSASILSILAGIIWWKYAQRNVVIGVLTVAVLIFGYSGYAYARGVQYGARQFKRSTLWDLITAALGLLGTLGMLVAFPPGILSILPVGVAYCIFAISGRTSRPQVTIDLDLRREIDRFTALGVVGTLASAGFLQLAQLVANGFLSASEAGNFSAATTLATPMSLVAGSVTIALYPAMAEAWGRRDNEGFKSTTDIAQRTMIVLLLTLFGPLIIASPLLSRIAWGTGFHQTPSLLPIMLLAVLLTSCGAVSTSALTTRSNRGMQISALGSLSGMVVGGFAWLVLIPRIRIYGVAAGFAIGAAIICLVPLITVWRWERHHWIKPHMNASIALASIFIGYFAARGNTAKELLLAVAFTICWLLLSLRAAGDLWAMVRAHRTAIYSSNVPEANIVPNTISVDIPPPMIPSSTGLWTTTWREAATPRLHSPADAASPRSPRPHSNARRPGREAAIQRHSLFCKVLLTVLPTTAAFGSLIPGISQLFAFRLVTLALIAMALLTRTHGQRPNGPSSAFTALAVVWLSFGVVGYAFVSDKTTALKSLVPVLLGLGLIGAIRRLALGAPVLQTLRRGWLTSFAITGLLGFWESLTGHHFSNYLTQGNGVTTDLINVDTRMIASVFGNPNAYGTFLVATIPIIFIGIIRPDRRSIRLFHLMLLVAAIALLLLTGGRLCMFAAGLEVVIFAIFSGGKRSRKVLSNLALAALSFIVLVTAFPNLLPTKTTQFSLQSIVSHLGQSADSSGLRRLNLYKDGLLAVWHSGGLGLGPGGFEASLATGNVPYPAAGIGSPHNAYLEIAADYSVFTLILVLLWLYLCARKAVAMMRSSDSDASAWGVATIALLIGSSIAALANSTFLPGAVNWTWLATVMAVTCLAPLSGNSSPRPRPARSQKKELTPR